MAKASELPTDWQDKLKKEERAAAGKKYRRLEKQADAIPLRAKTQYPTYIEGRMLFLLRGVAEIERVTVQEVIRRFLQEGLDNIMRESEDVASKKRTVRGGGSKKRTSAKRK